MSERGRQAMLFIILPAFNEEKGLPLLLRDIHNTCRDIPNRIIVVNDGSSDGTAAAVSAIAQKCDNVELVNHPVNRGLGEALRTGFQRVIEHKAKPAGCEGQPAGVMVPDLIVTMDADNTHAAECIPDLIQAIGQGADVAIASRYVAGGEQSGLNWLRRVLSWGAGRVMHFFFPIDGVRDYSCGYRAYRLSVLEMAIGHYGEKLIESHSFAAMVELLLKIIPLGARTVEVPLKLHYERKAGPSKMKIGQTVWGYVNLIYRLKKQTWGPLEWAEE